MIPRVEVSETDTHVWMTRLQPCAICGSLSLDTNQQITHDGVVKAHYCAVHDTGAKAEMVPSSIVLLFEQVALPVPSPPIKADVEVSI